MLKGSQTTQKHLCEVYTSFNPCLMLFGLMSAPAQSFGDCDKRNSCSKRRPIAYSADILALCYE